jgi:hypothetical protein
MNAPHVKALVFKVDHGPTVNYGHAKPLEFEQQHFGVHIDAETATFTMKTHYAKADDALAVVMPFVHAWELNAGLKHGPEWFRLVYQGPEFVDRNPTPGDIRGDGILAASQAKVHAGAVVTTKPASYPEPAGGLSVDPDVMSMYGRYIGHLQGKEHLASMAYFCVTVLSAGRRRDVVAKKYQISRSILTKLSHLASEKGGPEARKSDGVFIEFTTFERAWIIAAVKAIIRRSAEVAFGTSQKLPQITLTDLPPLDPAEES